MKSWVEFWNADNPIYVNERHKLLHYRRIASDIIALIPEDGLTILDYGCGEALSADLIAGRCRKLYLSDAAPNVRGKLEERFASNSAISVLSPEAVATLPAASLDLVIVHSLAQYLAKADFAALITTLAGKLREGGRIIVGDILPEDLSAITDAKALLEFGFQGGFLVAAGTGLVRAALSDYRKIRSELGLTHYAEAEMLALLEKAGLTARRLEKNLGHNPARMAFAAGNFTPDP